MWNYLKLLFNWVLDRTLLPLVEAFSPHGEHEKEDK